MYICLLGRQPEISLAELRSVYGKESIELITPDVALVDSYDFDLSTLGGVTKYGLVVQKLKSSPTGSRSDFVSVSKKITHEYFNKWKQSKHKITLGISAYGFKVSPRDVQKTGISLKNSLKKSGVSMRLVPNAENTLSTAVSHNNKLGLSESKVEIIIVNSRSGIFVAESRGAQNISAYAFRDRMRPRRDAFVGMLPPKLAQIMLNLAIGNDNNPKTVILDPFCGTGTVLQEAILRDFSVIGTDLSEKMVEYTKDNLEWLMENQKSATGKAIYVSQADAMDFNWKQSDKISAVVCETYLGQPFSAPPSPEKLREVVRNCDHIISSFLKNIRPQLQPGTKLCIAVPSWQSVNGRFTHLPLTKKLGEIGYRDLLDQQLLYHRPDQVVARQLLVLST